MVLQILLQVPSHWYPISQMDIFGNFLTNSLLFASYIIVYYPEGGDHGRERGWQDNQAMEWHCQVEYFQ